METGGRANNGVPDPLLIQESALGTQKPSQNTYPPKTSAEIVALEPFIWGRTRGALCMEDNLARCFLDDATDGFNNLLRLAML